MQQKRDGDPLAEPEVGNNCDPCPTNRSRPSTARLRRLSLEERATEGAKAMTEYKAEARRRARQDRALESATAGQRGGTEEEEMRNATAAEVFVAVSLVVIAAAVLIVRGYLQRR